MSHRILCINGSDSSGRSGVQADIRTANDLGATALTAITSVTVQNATGITHLHELPADLILGQVRSIYEEVCPQAVKVGMVGSAAAIRSLADEIVGCRNVVCSPGILASHGDSLMSDEALHAFVHHLLPITRLLMLKCTDAEVLLGQRITSDDDMLLAAARLHNLGAEWVMLRGGSYVEGRVNALLSGGDECRFFSSLNVDGWQQHGVSSGLSTAVSVRLAMGDDVPSAIQRAHTYVHNKVVYAVENKMALRPAEIYNDFLSLLADNYCQAHDVAFYASRLAIGTRYLSQVTKSVVGRSPKQIIDEYLLSHIEQQLLTTNLSIQQIADAMGFPSQVAFSKFFRSKKGLSPQAFRRG